MKLAKEARVGLLAATALVIFYFGVNFLKGKEVFKHTHTYYAIYRDARGLNTSVCVLLNGLKVGKVQTINILPESGHSILVTLAIDKNIQLTNTTVAKLESNNFLFGEKVINLFVEDGTALKNRDTLLSSMEVDSTKMFIDHTLSTLQNVQSLIGLTYQFITSIKENTDQVNEICTNLALITQKLHQTVTINEETFNRIGSNIAEISKDLSDKEVGLRPLLTMLNQLVNEIGDIRIKDIGSKLNNILSSMANSPLHDRFPHILMNLDSLLVDIRENPDRYVQFSVFGKKIRAKRGLNPSRSKPT